MTPLFRVMTNHFFRAMETAFAPKVSSDPRVLANGSLRLPGSLVDVGLGEQINSVANSAPPLKVNNF